MVWSGRRSARRRKGYIPNVRSGRAGCTVARGLAYPQPFPSLAEGRTGHIENRIGVVAGILGNLERTRHADKRRMVLDEIEELLPEALADVQLRACGASRYF